MIKVNLFNFKIKALKNHILLKKIWRAIKRIEINPAWAWYLESWGIHSQTKYIGRKSWECGIK